MYKYLGLIFNFGDLQMSLIFTIAVNTYIFGSYLAPYLWDKYGFD